MADSFLQYRSNEYNELRFWVYRKGELLFLYHEEKPNTDELLFTFWKINNSTWDIIEEKCLESIKANEYEEILSYNYQKMKHFFLKYMFRSWNIDEEMLFEEEGCLDNESYAKLLGLHPVILRELVTQLFEYTLSEEDLEKIGKQGHLLFAKNQSVSNPHKMISLYCNLTEMWSKFGLNYFDLKRLPLYEKNALKKILSIENQIRAAEIKQMEAKSNSNAGRGVRR